MDQLLVDRYASIEMANIFQPVNIALTWRKLWYGLAETQKEFGAPITEEQVKAMWHCLLASEIDLDRIAEIEKETKHDVVAHLKHFCEVCPVAAPIIHLGATSSFITDNADSILHDAALDLLVDKICQLIGLLADFAKIHADTATVGYTHFQPAQAVTVGKRACLWLQDMVMDAADLAAVYKTLQCRGAKGTVGTQATYLALFKNPQVVEDFDDALCKKLGFGENWLVCGQTFSRKFESRMADVIAGMGITFNKMGTDIRLLSHTGDLYESFGSNQVGSSAMPYKRNPITSERLCSLARMLPHYRNILSEVAGSQWLERSLDDSAARRLTWPNMFLTADAVLSTAIKLVSSLNVGNVSANLSKHGAFMQSEEIIIRGVLRGEDRQELHERLLKHSKTANSDGFKFEELLDSDEKLSSLMASNPIDTGMAKHQVMQFLQNVVDPFLGTM